MRMVLQFPNSTQLITLVTAFFGGLALWWIDAPLPFLFGSIGACLALALLGVRLQGTALLSTVSRTVLGVAIGASITWEVLAQSQTLVASLLIVPIYVLIIAIVGTWFFQHRLGYDRVTSYYAAMPGALQDMVVFGAEAGANTRALSLIHATRLLLMVTIAPLILMHVFAVNLDNPLGPASAELPVYHNVVVIAVGIVGWQIARGLNLFGASIVGPILLAVPLSLLGLLTERPTEEAIMIAQYFIGIGVGVNYSGITRSEVRRDVVAAAGFVVVLLALAVTAVWLTSYFTQLNSVHRFLAFWPAGQAEIAILSLAAGANVGIVVIHHLVRIIFIILGAPLVANRVVNHVD